MNVGNSYSVFLRKAKQVLTKDLWGANIDYKSKILYDFKLDDGDRRSTIAIFSEPVVSANRWAVGLNAHSRESGLKGGYS